MDDADYGLTPREWLDSDPVPLTPDIDFTDPEQRIAWIRANNEENEARRLELEARRNRGRGSVDRDDRDDRAGPGERRAVAGTTTVVPVRFLNAEQRALVRVARREGVTVSDLVRRWVRAGLDAANEVDPEVAEPDEREQQRAALAHAADAVVERITDELRRWREIVVATG